MEAAQQRPSTVPAPAEEVISPRAVSAAVVRTTAADPSRVAADQPRRPLQVLAMTRLMASATRRRRRASSTRPVLP